MKSKAKEKNAIILCSGGIDSSVCSYYIKKRLHYQNFIILFFNYGQKSLFSERKCSKFIAKSIKAKFLEIALPELMKLSSSLINIKGRINKLSKSDLKDTKKESEKYYVPSRNLLFLSYAISLAESLFIKEKRVYDIFLGFKCEGSDSYPDATLSFIEKLNNLNKSSTLSKSKIIAPLINKDKEDIIILGNKLNVNLKETFSCYAPINNKHCGFCLACMMRKQGFYWSNLKDPTKYENN